MFHTFQAFFTSSTPGSNESVALIKEKKTKPTPGFEYSVNGSNTDFDNNKNNTKVDVTTGSAFCASLCAAFRDILS